MSADTTVRCNYIGACALLGRLSNNPGLTDDDRDCIALALQDCANAFPGRFEVVATSPRGWSLEPTS